MSKSQNAATKGFCTNCGVSVQPDARFCAACGHRIARPSAAEATSESGADEIAGQRRVTLRRPNRGCLGCVWGLLWVTAGLGGLTGAVLIGLTVFGLPVAAAAAVGSLMFLAYGIYGVRQFSCPYCGKKLRVPGGRENVKCGKCQQRTVVDWI